MDRDKVRLRVEVEFFVDVDRDLTEEMRSRRARTELVLRAPSLVMKYTELQVIHRTAEQMKENDG